MGGDAKRLVLCRSGVRVLVESNHVQSGLGSDRARPRRLVLASHACPTLRQPDRNTDVVRGVVALVGHVHRQRDIGVGHHTRRCSDEDGMGVDERREQADQPEDRRDDEQKPSQTIASHTGQESLLEGQKFLRSRGNFSTESTDIGRVDR